MMDETPELPKLSGPTLEPLGGRKPEQLVIMCHGVGSDGDDLIGLAPYFQKVLPGARFVSPHAPYNFDGAPTGYQWFSLQDMSLEARNEGTRASAPILNAFIDEQLAACGLEDKDFALVGFSQGTMMSLHVGLRRAVPCAGIIGYSGMLIDSDSLGSEIAAKPPVLLCHGQADDVVPFDFMPAALEVLRQAGVSAEGLARPGLGHGLDDDSVKAGMFFLAECFGVNLQDLGK
jgi:phospholipase/carboxylesterase